MGNVIQLPLFNGRPVRRRMVEKLIESGYLQHARRNDPTSIEDAIDKLRKASQEFFTRLHRR
jgi:hypothetical protein